MAITLYAAPGSTNTQRVVVVLKELGLDYKIHLLQWSDIKTDAHVQLQPFGQVPVLDDDGFILYESRAIARYLAVKYGKGTTLIPRGDDIQALARFDAAASVEQSDFEAFAGALALEKFHKPAAKADEARAAEVTARLDTKLDGYERILSQAKYLAGDNITLVDLFHLPNGYIIDEKIKSGLFQKKERPNVARWWAEVSSRPSWAAVKESAWWA